jgi:O-antigen ligase
MNSPANGKANPGVADTVWAGLLAIWLISVMLLGGARVPLPSVQTYMVCSSVIVIACSLWRLRNGLPSGASAVAASLAALSFALILAQLIPIPYDMWQALPGREQAVRAFEAIGAAPDNLALSLSPAETKRASLSLLPPLAAFLGVLSVPRRLFWFLSGSIFLCAMVGALIGIIQKSQGAASGLYFYRDPGLAKFASGTFANRNFFATQLFTAVPFIAAFTMVWAAKWNLRPILVLAFTVIYIGILVAVLAAIGSRAGILLSMVSVLVTFLLVFRNPLNKHTKIGVGKGVLLMLVALVIMAQASMVGILRLAETDPVNDLRTTISAVSFQAAKAQFPAGSGFGTFVPVYQLYETSEVIVDGYVNHAHNEWLELVIEGGAPAIALIAAFMLWFFYVMFKTIRLPAKDPANAHIRAAGFAMVFMLLHAVVDFPLRTDALLTLFGLCVGFLALSTVSPEPIFKRQKSSQSTKTPREFKTAGRGFGARQTASTPNFQDDTQTKFQ